ncbi:MAG: hypothetical protein QM765_16845 [Myxococcales bacterium]
MKATRSATSDAPAGVGSGPGARAFAVLAVAAGLAHLAAMLYTRTLRPEHVIADGLVIVLPWFGGRAYEFVSGAFPAWIFGALYDGQRFVTSLRGAVHTGDLEALELKLFPGPGGLRAGRSGGSRTPSRRSICLRASVTRRTWPRLAWRQSSCSSCARHASGR